MGQIITHAGKTLESSTRRETFEGREHVVAPVVMIVSGVLPGSDGPVLTPEEEVARYPAAWNGRPVPVLHPEKNGQQVSANSPDVIERNSIGHVFNTHYTGGKLKGEAWLDEEKAKRLGHGALIERIEAGEVMELSTGFFSDLEQKAGTYNGRDYIAVHRDIRPDHLALLPDEVGACSVADGCGTRNNAKAGGFMSKMQGALNTIAEGLGLRDNCQCEGDETMDDAERIKAQADKLVANGKLSAKDIEKLQDFDPEQRRMVRAIMDSMEDAGEATGEEETIEDFEQVEGAGDEEPIEGMSANRGSGKGKGGEDIDTIVANRVDQAIRRRDVTEKLTANADCPFSKDDMAGMSVNHLEKLERSIRPVDYSGQGGMATNAGTTENVQPLTMGKGVLGAKRKQ